MATRNLECYVFFIFFSLLNKQFSFYCLFLLDSEPKDKVLTLFGSSILSLIRIKEEDEDMWGLLEEKESYSEFMLRLGLWIPPQIVMNSSVTYVTYFLMLGWPAKSDLAWKMVETRASKAKVILVVLTFLHVITHYDELGLVPNWPWFIIRGLFSYGLETYRPWMLSSIHKKGRVQAFWCYSFKMYLWNLSDVPNWCTYLFLNTLL